VIFLLSPVPVRSVTFSDFPFVIAAFVLSVTFCSAVVSFCKSVFVSESVFDTVVSTGFVLSECFVVSSAFLVVTSSFVGVVVSSVSFVSFLHTALAFGSAADTS
jgi:hypothetical protein